MPSINAALGIAQMKVLEKRISFKKRLAKKYSNVFEDCNEIEFLKNIANTHSNYWLSTIRFNSEDDDYVHYLKQDLLFKAHKNGLFIRPAWKLLHKLPMYLNNPKGNDTAEKESARLINLPSSPQLIDF